MIQTTFSVFPTGFRSISRIIAPQSIDTVYVKGHKSKLYVVSRFALRGEQRVWSMGKYKKPSLDEAWDLSAMAKEALNNFQVTRERRKRRPTWKESWLAHELSHLRSLAVEWMSHYEDVVSRKVFLVDKFMTKGLTEAEKEASFNCPDGCVPSIVIETEWGTQSAGSLWLDEEWEEAKEVTVLSSKCREVERTKEDLIQRMWRFIPDDTYLYCQLTTDTPTGLATPENLADTDEVIRREDSLQYAIQHRRLRQRQQS